MGWQQEAVLAGLAASGRTRHWRSDAAMDRAIARREPWPAPAPRPVGRVAVSARDEPEGRIVRLTPPGARGTVVALHGGAYVFGPDARHWTVWRRLALAWRREVVAPVYRLAPEGTAGVAVPWVARIAADADADALLGDSAGGGLALAAALLLRERDRRPALLLSAPWLDATMDEPWRLERDPWLSAEQLRRTGALWAGGLPVDHPYVSPLLHDLSGLGPTTVASGTRDVLHQDARRLRQRAPGPVRLLTGEGLLHNYPFLPIPEARPALRAFADALREGPAYD